ncbi:MAG: hypothetical protein HFF50_05570 [Lawsonibacter sp.]|nr:hypothetical protein [Lawsonibacter sp.]
MFPTNQEPGHKSTDQGPKRSPEHRPETWELNAMLAARPAILDGRLNLKRLWLAGPLFASAGVSIASLLLFCGVLSAQFTGWVWRSGQGEPAQALLTGYLRWYWALLAVCGGGILVNALLAVLQVAGAVRHCRAGSQWKRQAQRALLELFQDKAEEFRQEDEIPLSSEELQPLREIFQQGEDRRNAGFFQGVGVFLCLMAVAVFAACLVTEDLIALPGRAQADLEQIESGELERVVVWISPKCRPAHLAGPYGSRHPTTTTRYGIISEETGGEWVRVYVPDDLDFALNADRLYDENRSIAWNWENAQMYAVAYTSQLHLVVHIQPEWPNEATIQKR